MFPIFAWLAILPLISTSAAAALPAPVLDIHGKELAAGSRYYIVPVQKDKFGGLTIEKRNNSCPYYVRQSTQFDDDGINANFVPVDGSKTIRLSTDMNVKFFEWDDCSDLRIWTLAPPDKATGLRYVKFGGTIGNPGQDTVNNWFRIERSGDNYKMVFCPGVCKTCNVPCRDLGVHTVGNDRWLVLGGRSFPVKFKKLCLEQKC